MYDPSFDARASCETLTALCLSAFLMLCGATLTASTANAVATPATFDRASRTVLLSVQAAGVQIYECRADEAGRLTWMFREPLAILTSDGKTIGRHFGGPSWQLNDGGKVVGKVVAQRPGASDKDITQLHLDVSDREGTGLLTRATAIERLDTHGGAFAGVCQQAGELHLEPYSARYVFFGE